MSSKENQNVYESGRIPDIEKERLQKFSYPVLVSEELLGETLGGKTILDIGAGANTELGKWIGEHNGKYIALDVHEPFLKEQQGAGSSAIQGSADKLPFSPNSVDITHTRFVLLHLSPEARDKAIKEAINAAKERSLFLEFDYSSFEGGPLVNQFRDLAIKMMAGRQDPYMGKKLKEEVERVVSGTVQVINERRFRREKGHYYNDLIPLARVFERVSEKINPEMALEFKKLIVDLEKEAEKDNPEGFIPPDIVSVEVIK